MRISFNLDCSSSTNVVFHRGDLVHTDGTSPGETKAMHHLMPAEQEAWAWGYRPSFTMYCAPPRPATARPTRLHRSADLRNGRKLPRAAHSG